MVEALRTGCWLVLENANLCPSSVLDRLNSLCEAGGQLLLSEKGSQDGSGAERIAPHANFRIFMTMDPKHGELSPAMRNRGVELHLSSDPVLTTSTLHASIQSALLARGLEDWSLSPQLLLPSGIDVVTETALAQKSLIRSADLRLDDETKALWLLQTSPAKILHPLLRLWAHVSEFQPVIDKLKVIIDSIFSNGLAPNYQTPIWEHHLTLIKKRQLNFEFLLWQVRQWEGGWLISKLILISP